MVSLLWESVGTGLEKERLVRVGTLFSPREMSNYCERKNDGGMNL